MSELARFHAGFATLETSLNLLMAFALGKKQKVGHAILARIRNIADRIEIIKAVAAEGDHLNERQKASIQIACEQALKLNGRRNVYAHGMYEHRGDEIRVTPYAYSPRKTQKEVLKLERVKQDVDLIDQVFISTLLYAGVIPDHVLAQLEAQPELPPQPAGPKGPST